MQATRNDYSGAHLFTASEKCLWTNTQSPAAKAGLHKDLSRSQVVMIGLGGAIGTGLILWSGMSIGYAGPAVIVSFAIAGFAAMVDAISPSSVRRSRADSISAMLTGFTTSNMRACFPIIDVFEQTWRRVIAALRDKAVVRRRNCRII
jgi:hypothetical protein